MTQCVVPSRLPLNKVKFKLWLKSKGDRRAGKSFSEDSCPLAMYLKTQVKGCKIKVSGPEIFIGEKMYLSPDWVEDFVSILDDSKENVGDTVSGLWALAVLDDLGY